MWLAREKMISCLAINCDGTIVAYSCFRDKSIKLWKINKYSYEDINLIGHTDIIKTLIFAKIKTNICKFENLISCSADLSIRIWNLEGKLVKTLLGHMDVISSISCTEDGLILSASNDRTVMVWDVSKESHQPTILEGHIDSVRAVSSVGHRAVGGGRDGRLFVWDYATSKLLTIVRAHLFAVNSLACCRIGGKDSVISCSMDWAVKVHDIVSGQLMEIIRGHSSYIETLAIVQQSSTRAFLTGGCYDGTTHVWDLSSKVSHIAVVYGSGKCVNAVAVSSGKFTSTFADKDGRLYGFEISLIVRNLNWYRRKNFMRVQSAFVKSSMLAGEMVFNISNRAADRVFGCHDMIRTIMTFV